MIIYNPLDGHPFTHPLQSQAKHLFLMTRLGNPIPAMVKNMRTAVTKCCKAYGYSVIDAQTRVTGRDILLKIWKLIASSPLSVGIIHEDISDSTRANIYYELGVAQALGKETVIIKSPKSKIPSDLIRSEYVTFDKSFKKNFTAYIDGIFEAANYYELVADQLEKNPILALDYLKRAYLINGDKRLKTKAKTIKNDAGLEERAKNSVELIAASF